MALAHSFEHRLDQVGALPVRLHAEGFVEVMLVASPGTQRWSIPTGWPGPNQPPHEAALRQVRDGVSLVGHVAPDPFGFFTYDKRLASGLVLPCRVAVHLLRVTGQLERPRGRAPCESIWLTSREAAKRVCNLSLQRLIARAGRSPELLRPTPRRLSAWEGRTGEAAPKPA